MPSIKELYDAGSYPEMWRRIDAESAAQRPEPRVQAFAAFLYERGRGGVEKDARRALALYQAAAEAGHAQSFKGVWRYYVYWDGRDQAGWEAAAEMWNKRGAEAGDPVAQASYAQRLLGNFTGAVTLDEKRAAFKMLQASAEGNARLKIPGSRWGMLHLGSLYLGGLDGVVVADAKKGIEWWERAAYAGNYQAAHNLSAWYESGKEGLPVDPLKAYRFRYLAMLSIDRISRKELARLRGLVVEKLGDETAADAAIARGIREAEKAAESFEIDWLEVSPLHY